MGNTAGGWGNMWETWQVGVGNMAGGCGSMAGGCGKHGRWVGKHGRCV